MKRTVRAHRLSLSLSRVSPRLSSSGHLSDTVVNWATDVSIFTVHLCLYRSARIPYNEFHRQPLPFDSSIQLNIWSPSTQSAMFYLAPLFLSLKHRGLLLSYLPAASVVAWVNFSELMVNTIRVARFHIFMPKLFSCTIELKIIKNLVSTLIVITKHWFAFNRPFKCT